MKRFTLVSLAVLASLAVIVLGVVIDIPTVDAQNFGKLPVSWLMVDRQIDVNGIMVLTPENRTTALSNTFTIPASTSWLWVTSSGAVTSSTSEAIQSGWAVGQVLLLKNAGTQNITIKNTANTDLGAADVTLGATDQLCVIWNGTVWDKLFTADN